MYSAILCATRENVGSPVARVIIQTYTIDQILIGYGIPITHYPLPITHDPLPITHYPLPITQKSGFPPQVPPPASLLSILQPVA